MLRFLIGVFLVVVFVGLAVFVNHSCHNTDADFYCSRGYDRFVNADYDNAFADFDHALRLDPKHILAYNGRGAVWRTKGEYDKALADFDEALRLNPNFAPSHSNRGTALHKKGKHEKALAAFNQALRIDNKYFFAYVGRGDVWISKGQYDKASTNLKQAIQIDPKSVYALNHFAWFQATCPDARYRDGKNAVLNATKACELDGGENFATLDTLAAAYAENGDFEKACQWQTKAIELAPDNKTKELLRAHLTLYKQGKPYHEDPKKKS